MSHSCMCAAHLSVARNPFAKFKSTKHTHTNTANEKYIHQYIQMDIRTDKRYIESKTSQCETERENLPILRSKMEMHRTVCLCACAIELLHTRKHMHGMICPQLNEWSISNAKAHTRIHIHSRTHTIKVASWFLFCKCEKKRNRVLSSDHNKNTLMNVYAPQWSIEEERYFRRRCCRRRNRIWWISIWYVKIETKFFLRSLNFWKHSEKSLAGKKFNKSSNINFFPF